MIKNYTTKISAPQTIGEIQAILATHGARKIMLDYSEAGKATAVTFALQCGNNLIGYRLEAKIDGVLHVMKKDNTKCDEAQAERIAWRNLKDWIAAQIALVETEQATMEELFFHRLLHSGDKTLYDTYKDGTAALPFSPAALLQE